MTWSFETSSDNYVSIDQSSGTITGINCGTSAITATVLGETLTIPITVTPKPLDTAIVTVDPEADLSYTGSEITPSVTVRLGEKLLSEDTDYTVAYDNNTAVGTAEVTVSGTGNYTGQASASFEITKAQLTDADSSVTVVKSEVPYTGDEIQPEVIVYKGDTLLAASDYTVSYDQNTDAGEASVTVTGQGNYEGTLSATFRITPIDLTDCTIDIGEEQEYTGSQITPAVSIQWNGQQLEQNRDFEVSYGDNLNVGSDASATVKGIGNFSGERTLSFRIVPADLSGADVEEIDPQTYNGSEITVTPVVSMSGRQLVLDSDYQVQYENNVDAGQATAVIEGIGNYTGEKPVTFDIQPLELEGNCSFGAIEDFTYSGEEVRPDVTLFRETEELTLGKDHTISYENNTNAGDRTATAIATGIGNYSGTLEEAFTILALPFDSEAFQVTAPDQTFTGRDIEAPVTVTWNRQTLTKDTDYTVTYDNNKSAGTATVTVSGIGNFTDQLSGSFEILKADLADCTVSAIPDQTYSGSALEPLVSSVMLGDYELTEEWDYQVSYSDNINIGTAAVTLSASEGGDFTGTKTVTFQIIPIDLEGSGATVQPIADQIYTGGLLTPEVTVTLAGKTLIQGTDYSVAYRNYTNAGTASVRVTGIGNYKGTLSGTFTILPMTFNDSDFTVSVPDQTYTGAAIEAPVTVTWEKPAETIVLKEGQDYTVQHSSRTDAGTASVRINGTGNYDGSLSGDFRILKADLKDCTIESIPDQTYTGSPLRPELSILLGSYALESGTDYTATYTGNTEIGTATVTLYASGNNFTGEKTASFEIVPIDLAENDAAVQVVPDEQTYTGEPFTPEVIVRLNGTILTAEEDYTVAYDSNTDAGNATVTVTGCGNYTGTVIGSFRILPRALTPEDCVFGEIPEQTYTGAAILPTVTVTYGEKTLVPGVDYTAAYSNNKNVGEAVIEITAAGNYSGSLGTATFSIIPADLADCTAEAVADQAYTGSAITPPVTLSLNGNVLEENKDYLLAYTNNIEAGTAVITISGINNYTGTRTVSFTILAKQESTPEQQPAAPSVSLPRGTVAKDAASGSSYRVTSDAAGEPSVEYLKPANKKKTSVTIPGVVVIDHIPCKVTSVAANAFKNNKKLKKVTIGSNVTKIGKNAFRGCSRLVTVKIGSGTAAIQAGAFYGCTSLKNVTIPASVTSIGKQAFYNCSHLVKITIKTKKLTSRSIGKMAFSKLNSKVVVKVPSGKRKAYQKLLRKKGLRASARVK